MGNILNEDFADFLVSLNEARVDYILVGGYAVIYHGYNRTTGDMDVWVNPSKENYNKLLVAFSAFGLSAFDMTEQNFLEVDKNDVFTFGRPPVCIDILTHVKGLEFKETFERAVLREFDSVPVRVIDIRDLIAAKKAANRSPRVQQEKIPVSEDR
ncbi:hypothetical protein BH11BAC7_BH11BAC7_03130 [soil metagenome]